MNSLTLRRKAMVSLAMALAGLEEVSAAPGCHLVRVKVVEAQALAAWCWPDCAALATESNEVP
ncbi:MAG: hypothetical protein V3T24_04750 [Longimicrobiales bacterium]